MTVSTAMQSDIRPLLAKTAGRYREYAPSSALAPHFRCLWSHELLTAGPLAIVPDGYCDLLLVDGRIYVAGPDRTAAFPPIAPGMHVLGARFAPGAGANWLTVPLSEITGLSIPLRDLAPEKAVFLESRLSDCVDGAAARSLFASLLTELARDEREAEPEARLIFAAADSGAGRIRDLQQRLDIGERQLRRRAHHHFGYGIKTLERVRRLQRFMALCRADKSLPLAVLALEAGFSDQAHMTREIADLTTLTPAAMHNQLIGNCPAADRFVQDARNGPASLAQNNGQTDDHNARPYRSHLDR
ncbi:helix-turn-helix domain-containing protein [Rhizobium sp. BK418]|uniref:helix-turn-helix domain-containing protein n=1 Tax=Rhizobium sp. BK418 TaxID=2512120 RepID=UPI0010D2A74E|nr:helix-turn-helix domain-containing protein [Rhizobium sp. BK418]TCS05107.1 helix-turn-helix protein [Rhizobium sp. BK418]